MCCGNKRAAMRASLPHQVAAPIAPRTASSPGGDPFRATETSLRYLGSAPLRVPGPVTGRLYEFSGARPMQAVDRRDATSLLRTRLFRPAQ